MGREIKWYFQVTLPNMENESSIFHPIGKDIRNDFASNLFHEPNKALEKVLKLISNFSNFWFSIFQ